MKKFLIICLILVANSQISQAKELKKQAKEQKVEEIKTFDFERIFAETEKYFQAAKNWKKLKCTAASAFVCTKRECPKIELAPDSHLILDRKSEIISLCKKKLCRYYPASFRQTGVFVTVRILDSDGIILRVLGDSRFKEISLIGLDAYISNGVCEKVD
jgi:hypothetical protein